MPGARWCAGRNGTTVLSFVAYLLTPAQGRVAPTSQMSCLHGGLQGVVPLCRQRAAVAVRERDRRLDDGGLGRVASADGAAVERAWRETANRR